jgi:hypothetical protein
MSNPKLAKMFEKQASEIENKSNPSKSKMSGRGKERKQRRWKGHWRGSLAENGIITDEVGSTNFL